MNRPDANRLRTLAAPLAPLATLDLQEAGQRSLHDVIRRLHTGRWPLFRCVAMRQLDGVIYEVAQWCGKHEGGYSLVRCLPDGSGMTWQDTGMTWQDTKTAKEARKLLADLR